MASKFLSSRTNRRHLLSQWCHLVLRLICSNRRPVTQRTTTRRPSTPIFTINPAWILHPFRRRRREMRNRHHQRPQCEIHLVSSRSSMDLDTRNFPLGQCQQPQKHRKHSVHLQAEDRNVPNRGPITPIIPRRRLWLTPDPIWSGRIPRIFNR